MRQGQGGVKRRLSGPGRIVPMVPTPPRWKHAFPALEIVRYRPDPTCDGIMVSSAGEARFQGPDKKVQAEQVHR
jgi:hypothetical protein